MDKDKCMAKAKEILINNFRGDHERRLRADKLIGEEWIEIKNVMLEVGYTEDEINTLREELTQMQSESLIDILTGEI